MAMTFNNPMKTQSFKSNDTSITNTFNTPIPNQQPSNKNTLNTILTDITKGKTGLEIGGPSPNTGSTIYQNADIMDNVIFSANTVWSNNHDSNYHYHEGKVGKVIIKCSTNMKDVANDSYDFLFASHVLEHIANPLKALFEWKRVVKPNGYLILILPEKSVCFDHKRNVSQFSVLLKQYEANVDESDLSTLDEILENHDLSMDLPAGSFEKFRERSLQNFENRCLHHYVYSPELLMTIAEFIQCKFIYTVTDDINIWFIMQKI